MHVKNIFLGTFLFFAIGCVGIYEYSEDPQPNNQVVNPHYVNTYLTIPYAVRTLIAPAAQGYFTPSLSRYGEYLYPAGPYDPYDLPCYVRADFNNDGMGDFAFLFSMDEWYYGNWYVTTKLIVVLSNAHGYHIGCDVVLGTVEAHASVPIEEFWGISYMSPGYYQVITYINGVEIIETIFLPDGGFYLACLDPDDESVFFAVNDEVHELEWENETLSKGKVKEGIKKRGVKKFDKSKIARTGKMIRKK